jgi:hypothetical protein
MKALWLSVLGTAVLSGLAFADILSTGNYMASVTPAIDSDAAGKIAQQLKQFDQLRSVKVNPSDSTVYFTVKKEKEIDLAEVQKAVSTAVPGAMMSNPTSEPVSATHKSPDTDGGPGQATGY